MENIQFEGVQVVLQQPGFLWLDMVGPTKKNLAQLANKLGMHETTVRDCLDPHHLPKFERLGSFAFLILRIFDNRAKVGQDSLHEITRKVAVFAGEDFVLTVRRSETEWMKKFVSKWKDREGVKTIPFLLDLMNDAFQSYVAPSDGMFEKLDELEKASFRKNWNLPLDLSEVYPLKRRAASLKRVLVSSLDAIGSFKFLNADSALPEVREVRENLQNNIVYAEELNEGIQQFISLSLAVQASKTNESMRFLAVFSAFFLPLTLFVGIYGMNFKFMPELEHPYGYAGAWISMLAITAVIAFWFKKKRWF